MLTPERACLVIADISGYTSFLAGAELDHAQDILADLVNTVVSSLRPTFRLSKLEGDAAFTYAITERSMGRCSRTRSSAATSRSSAGSATSARRRHASATPASSCRSST